MLASVRRVEILTRALLTIENVVVTYPDGRGRARQAVADVSLQVKKGESLGLVGESGCGKSSLAKAVMRFVKPISGHIRIDTVDLTTIDKYRLRQLRPKFQMIFQDSIAALNPRRNIGATIAMPLKLLGKVSRAERIDRACQMMQDVGLDPSGFDLLPYQLSGGQCQRVQIARALITQPELLICDEPVSALDVSIQGQIINLLDKLREKSKLTMLFISHDLAVVKNICDRIAVMYAGTLCEVSDSENLYQRPMHPYSKILLEAIPTIGKFNKDDMVGLKTANAQTFDVPDHGCRFRGRCFQAKQRCANEEPILKEISPEGLVACHYPLFLPPS